MRLHLTLLALAALVSADAFAKKPKKGAEPAAPTVGWSREASWTADCWVPPDFSAMSEGQKRLAWQESRDAIVAQWRGERGDGISLNSRHVDGLETILLSQADRIESVVAENLEQCRAVAGGSGTTSQWEEWIVKVAGRLTEGECPYPPLDYTAFNYLSVNSEWQGSLYICKGDHVNLHGTEGDYYQITPGGPWINVAGDPAKPARAGLPCTLEGCFEGQLVMRFTSENGVSNIQPVGVSVDFVAPDHGRIEVMINDDNLADNKFKVEKGLEHHTGLEVKPASGG